jgi:hypothetical protein
MVPTKPKRHPEILELIKAPVVTDLEDKPYTASMSIFLYDNIPRQRSKKTTILRSYVNQGLLDGIRKFDPNVVSSKFIYCPHMMVEEHILERRPGLA